MQVPKEDKDKTVHDTFQDDEDKEVSVQEFDTVRSNIFNFLSIRLVIIIE